MEKLKENKTLLGVGIILLLLGVMGMSYAWFSASVKEVDVKDQVVTTGTLELTYIDGAEIKLVNARPGATITKEVRVKNTGTLDAEYNLVWQVLKNEITNDEMVMSLTCQRLNPNGDEEEKCEGLDETPISGNKVLKGRDIPSGYTHVYEVTITFKETNSNQNYNQGKNFTGVLGVDEYKAPQPISCIYDGELTEGATFEKGPYTYSYKQESSWDIIYMSSNNNDKPVFQNSNLDNYEVTKLASWKTIDADGWGVVLTDKDSNDPVTEAPCTYINDKPVVSMTGMFYKSKASSIDLSNFITSEVTDMSAMFYGTSYLRTIDVGDLDTSKVTSFKNMFSTTNLTNIYGLDKIDTSNVTDMSLLFHYSRGIKNLNLSNFNTSKVTTMEAMFYQMTGLSELDLSSFDTSNVTNMRSMFASAYYLKKIYVGDKFITDNVTNSLYMFRNLSVLEGGYGTIYNSDNPIDKTYARIDGVNGLPGYFTQK